MATCSPCVQSPCNGKEGFEPGANTISRETFSFRGQTAHKRNLIFVYGTCAECRSLWSPIPGPELSCEKLSCVAAVAVSREQLQRTMKFLLLSTDDYFSALSPEEACACRVLQRFNSDVEDQLQAMPSATPTGDHVTIPTPFTRDQIEIWRQGPRKCDVKSLVSGIKVWAGHGQGSPPDRSELLPPERHAPLQ